MKLEAWAPGALVLVVAFAVGGKVALPLALVAGILAFRRSKGEA